jgi:signal transduction histidine kinase
MVRKSVFYDLILFSVFCIPLLFNSNLKAQDKLKLVLSGVQEENRQLSESEWHNLQFLKGSKIYISFTPSITTAKKIIYRVLLDTQLIETDLLENLITLKDLPTGVHILKITGVTDSNVESEPLTLSFSVSDQQVIKQAEVKDTKPDSGGSFFSNPLFFFGAVSICIIEFALIILILFRTPKKEKHESPLAQELKQCQEEYIDVYNTHKRLKVELQDLKDYNEHLKKQKTELEATIKNLESVNVNLLEQKEKLTESKRQLELLHTQKDELFAMAIHDIKNPVSAIRGYIELLNSYDLNATEQHEIMTSLVNSSENVVKLTQSMCTIIAKDRPEPTLKFTPSSIKKIIDEICNQNFSYAKAKTIKLFNKSSVGLPDIAMDETKIQEVIENLVNNAIKYGPPDCTVEVRTYIKGKALTVEVQDTGVGIPEEDLKRVFQKGAVLTPKPTGVEQSSGLGLWIVKRIIEEHGGKVWVNSKVGNGSTFGFELPMEVKDRKSTMY